MNEQASIVDGKTLSYNAAMAVAFAILAAGGTSRAEAMIAALGDNFAQVFRYAKKEYAVVMSQNERRRLAHKLIACIGAAAGEELKRLGLPIETVVELQQPLQAGLVCEEELTDGDGTIEGLFHHCGRAMAQFLSCLLSPDEKRSPPKELFIDMLKDAQQAFLNGLSNVFSSESFEVV
jgi:hypothetical protein